MYYSRLSMLRNILNDKQIERFNDYLSGLNRGASENIRVSNVSKELNVPPSLASKILTECKKNGILKSIYVIKCPNCHMLIKKVDMLDEIPERSFECYSCEEEIIITTQDIEIIYEIIDKEVFIEGKQINNSISAKSVIPEDSMESIFLAGGFNEYIFCPTEEDYNILREKYNDVNKKKDTTKKKGDTLEEFIKLLFGLCPILSTASIKTVTNQIDCCVRNKMYCGIGVFNILGGRFYIECKNEKKTPRGDYMSKIHSIISIANAGNKEKYIKFGIIISKEKPPRTFKELSRDYYLTNGIIIISICGNEIEELIDNRGNLFELIERKADEIVLNATTDLREVGLYDC